MFFIAYLWRELSGRFRQTVTIGAALSLGIAAVIMISALASGVAKSESKVLGALYGVGTDITVTTPVTKGPGFGQITPSAQTQVSDVLSSLTSGKIPTSNVSAIAGLKGVAVAAGGLVLTESKAIIPGTAVVPPPAFQAPTLTSVIGVDPRYPFMGPYSAGRIVSGRGLTPADDDVNNAVLSSVYAGNSGLFVGARITVAGARFTVIGIEGATSDANPPDVFIPLARAQALAQLVGYVNSVYVKADNSGDVGAVSTEIGRLIPTATVSSSATLADQISGSLATVTSLATTLGVWLAVVALGMAFSGAGLMVSAAVTRRARDFGTLKALGWPNRRIVIQVVGESLVTGAIGATIGICLGLAASLLVSHVAPSLQATVQETNSTVPASDPGANGGFFTGTVGGSMTTFANPNATHTVSIPFRSDVPTAVLAEAVLLGISGGVVAGGFGGWRVARLRPSIALSRLE